MEVLTAERINILAKYDIEESRVRGDVYSKVEGDKEVRVGCVIEDPKGVIKLYVQSEYRDKDYIIEDYEKLRDELVSYANMWAARASRGKC